MLQEPRRSLTQGKESLAGGTRGLHSGTGGQANAEHGTTLGLVVASDASAMVLDDAVNGTQTEAGALSYRFGGVERVKDALRIAHSRTGIGKLQQDVRVFVLGGDFQRSSANFIEGIHGIFDDLDESLEQLFAVADHAREVFFNLQTDENLALRPPRFEHMNRAAQQDRQIDLSFLSGDLLGEAQETGDEIACALGLSDDLANKNVLLLRGTGN